MADGQHHPEKAMTLHTKAEIILGSALAVALLFIGYDQYRKAIDNAVAEKTAEILAKAQKEKDDSLSTRNAEYKTAIQDMQDRYDRLSKMTPQQIVIKAPEYVPGLQGKPPIQIVGPDTLPAPVGSAIIPPEDIQPLATAILDGKKCSLDLNKCQGDLRDWQGKYELKDQEAENWKKASKGGSWAKRFGSNVLKLGIGVAAGYAIAKR
jgi:cell division protein FtsB